MLDVDVVHVVVVVVEDDVDVLGEGVTVEGPQEKLVRIEPSSQVQSSKQAAEGPQVVPSAYTTPFWVHERRVEELEVPHPIAVEPAKMHERPVEELDADGE